MDLGGSGVGCLSMLRARAQAQNRRFSLQVVGVGILLLNSCQSCTSRAYIYKESKTAESSGFAELPSSTKVCRHSEYCRRPVDCNDLRASIESRLPSL